MSYKLPLKIEEFSDGMKERMSIIDSEGAEVFRFRREEDHDFGRLIVRAANCHDELISELESISSNLKASAPWEGETTEQITERIDDLIKRSRGES